MLKRLAYLVLLVASAYASAQNQTTAGPIVQMTGVGAPTAPCAADNYAGVLYVDTGTNSGGRMWVCDNTSGTWAWDHLVAAIAVAKSATITGGSFILGGCTAVTTVSVPGAVVSVNSATANPIFITAPTGNIGLFNIVAWVSAAGVVSVQGCALGALTSVPNFQARILMY